MNTTVKTLIKVAASALLISVVVHAFDVRGVAVYIAQVDRYSLAIASLLAFAVSAVHTARWLLVLKANGNQLGFGLAWRIVLIGHFFNQTLPSSVGGDAVRIWHAHRAGMSLADAANTVILDRMTTLLALLVVSAAALPWLAGIITNPATRWALMVSVGGGLAAFAALLLFRLPQLVLHWRIGRLLAKLTVLARSVMLRPRFCVPVLALSVFGYAAFAVVVFLLAHAMQLGVSLGDCLLLIPPVILVTVLPISIAGWGVREGAMVVAFGFVGVAPSQAFAVSIMFGVVLIIASLPGSVLWWLAHHAKSTQRRTE